VKGSLPWPTENPRAREEWDFRPRLLPKNEVWWCHRYEIGRICQTQPWRDDIQKFRRECGGNTYDAFWQKARKCFRTLKSVEWPSIFYTLWPQWPLKPYLSVNPKDRRTRINDWCRDEKPEALEQISFRNLFVNDRAFLSKHRIDLMLGRTKHLDKLEIENVGDTIQEAMSEIVALRIPGYTTDPELVEMFKEWLKQRGKEKGKEPTERLGAAAPTKIKRADLCAIGFWRLVRSGMSRQQAIIYTEKVSGRHLLANHASAWTRAMKRAEGLLRYRIGKEFMC
jgi:hypothetical protein